MASRGDKIQRYMRNRVSRKKLAALIIVISLAGLSFYNYSQINSVGEDVNETETVTSQQVRNIIDKEFSGDSTDTRVFTPSLSEVLNQGNTAETDINLDNNTVRNVSKMVNFFENSCESGESVTEIKDDGSFSCIKTENTDNQTMSISKSGDIYNLTIENGNSITFEDRFEKDTTIENTDNQSLKVDSSSINDVINITNGEAVTIQDDFEPDTVIQDDQDISVDTSDIDDRISIDNGSTITISDEYEADSNAETICTGSKYLAGDGSCDTDSFEENTDNQELTIGQSGDEYNLSIDNGNYITFTDRFEEDTTIENTDNQSLSVDSTNTDDVISLTDGGQITIDDQFEPNTDTNASTECSGKSYLGGDGSCYQDSFEQNTDNQNLDEVLNEGNTSNTDIDMNNNSVENVTLKHVRVPVGEDKW